MRLNKPLVLESIIVSLLLTVGIIFWQVIQGMILTYQYKPDIAASYASVEKLQSTVTFGMVVRADLTFMLMIGAGLFLFMCLYYRVRSRMKQRKARL
ncbi:quinol-cytochrome oxidoreductase complex cytochrome b subunit [Paenibacillus amylolyticus]|uniref:Quinol-cytochrome oxidoreductase complex cytochrome b subunit n=1 Tax=Paenibacillus amylolyticus TaxID=1451 RepID=A0AAP5H6J1_PAEAM|nr:hypothetical protein [Paenibacillus amylolyticus]MDR6726722.1 quinol-cytochrome oxidoreductase complex cytochrome b subunit [Paenibacillus amylolyticus]